MKKLIATLLMAAASLEGMAQKQVIADENAQQREARNFHSIKVSNAIDVFIVQGNEEGLAVSARSGELRDKIRSEVRNGVLRIWYEENMWKGGGNRKLKAYISVKNLDALEASGACDVSVSGKLESREMKLVMSGASDFKGSINADYLEVHLSGASDATIDGAVTALNVEASGASDLKGFDLQTEKCRVDASGASDVKVTVNKELSAEASGASGIHYRGSGVIKDIKTSGASSISHKE